MSTPRSDGTWTDYDPAWLAELAAQQKPALVAALRKCTTALVKSRAYIYFVNPASANEPGSEWQFAHSVLLTHPEHGSLVIDVLKDGRIGGVEFLSRL